MAGLASQLDNGYQYCSLHGNSFGELMIVADCVLLKESMLEVVTSTTCVAISIIVNFLGRCEVKFWTYM